MMSKRPPADEQTAPVNKGTAGHGGNAAGDERTMAVPKAMGDQPEDAKTEVVRASKPASLPADAGGAADKRRLPWPARDSHPVKADEGRARAPAPPPAAPPPPVRPPQAAPDAEMTRLFGASAAGARVAVSHGSASTESSSGEHDPVVGWLVVVDGPGKGKSCEIGAGANSIGRDHGQKVRLDFGDPEIHRDRHAMLVFDPRSRRFFLQPGDARNLTYLGDDVVLSPVELKGGETIVLGQTHLRFVPFCGKDFSWQ